MTQRHFIPRGAASLSINFDGPAREFCFLMLPRLTMLAFAAAIEPLRIANQLTKKELYRWYTLSEDGGPVRCSNGVLMTPDMALAECPENALSFVCAGVEPFDAAGATTLNWLRRRRAFGKPVGGICTGAFALAQAGMLKDRRFTLHWENQPSFREAYPDLEPTGTLYEEDRGIWTCGGGNAATEMMLEMIEADHGKELAITVADMCIHGRHGQVSAASSQKSSVSVAIGSRNRHLLQAIELMQETLEEPMSIADMAEQLSLSRRQIERLFKKYLGVTPNEYYYDLRVGRVYALLNETDLSVSEIAAAVGFSSTTHLATRFRKKFGTSPHSLRKSWSRDT